MVCLTPTPRTEASDRSKTLDAHDAPFAFTGAIYSVTIDVSGEPVNYPHVHTWVVAHVGRLLREFQVSVKREPPIPAGAPIDYVPKAEH